MSNRMRPEAINFPYEKVDAAKRFLYTIKPWWSRFGERMVVTPIFVPAGEQWGGMTASDEEMHLFIDNRFANNAPLHILAGAIEFQLQSQTRDIKRRMAWVQEEKENALANVCFDFEVNSAISRESADTLSKSDVLTICSRSFVFTEEDFFKWQVQGPPSLEDFSWSPEMLHLESGKSAEFYYHAITAEPPESDDDKEGDGDSVSSESDQESEDSEEASGGSSQESEDASDGESEHDDNENKSAGSEGDSASDSENDASEESKGDSGHDGESSDDASSSSDDDFDDDELFEDSGDDEVSEGQNSGDSESSNSSQDFDGDDSENSNDESSVEGEDESKTGEESSNDSEQEGVEEGQEGSGESSQGESSDPYDSESSDNESDAQDTSGSEQSPNGSSQGLQGMSPQEMQQLIDELRSENIDLDWWAQAIDFTDDVEQMWDYTRDEEPDPKTPDNRENALIELAADIKNSSNKASLPIKPDDEILDFAYEIEESRGISWTAQLARLQDSAFESVRIMGGTDMSYAKRNPNQGIKGPVLMGMFATAPNIMCLIDISPSMMKFLDKSISTFASLTETIMCKYGDTLTWVTADTQVVDVGTSLDVGRMKGYKPWFNINTRGTDLGGVLLDIIEGQLIFDGKNYKTPDMLSFITDGMFSWPFPEQEYLRSRTKIVVACTNGKAKFENDPRKPKWLVEGENLVYVPEIDR